MNKKVTDILLRKGSSIISVIPNSSVLEALQIMADKNIRYVPVFENDIVIGIVSINDVVKETILSQQETISQLKDYLHSSL